MTILSFFLHYGPTILQKNSSNFDENWSCYGVFCGVTPMIARKVKIVAGSFIIFLVWDNVMEGTVVSDGSIATP